MELNIPLMKNNISPSDIEGLVSFLRGNDVFTQSTQVAAFEKEWSDWLGMKYSIFVNSGSSANLVTMCALRQLFGEGEVIVPALSWVSDITSVLYAGFRPVFVDINPHNLAMNEQQVLEKINKDTRAVFLTHVLGFNGLTTTLLQRLKNQNIPLIEDACESHGAQSAEGKVGSLGYASNFSFYYAHHMTTVEGGMICTNDDQFYDVARMMRSHGLVRESAFEKTKKDYQERWKELNPEFIFAYPGFNVRSTEINAVLGRGQLQRLDQFNQRRKENCQLFYENLDSSRYWTDFDLQGAVNYAFVVVLKEKNEQRCQRLMEALKKAKVEFRRGTSGGGNQLRQPYLKDYASKTLLSDFPVVEHVHFYGFYIGNYPSLEKEKILGLCRLLNSI